MYRPTYDIRSLPLAARCGVKRRRGLSLVELLSAAMIMALIAGVLGGLAMSVQMGNQHSYAVGTTTQHGRVVLDRIQRLMNEATANEQFPGIVSFSEKDGRWEFPDTVVIWHPEGSPTQPDGLPLARELIIVCPNPEQPNQLLELRLPNDNRVVPPLSDTRAWETSLEWIKRTTSATRVVLTDRLRTASLDYDNGGKRRGAARFEVTLRPSESQLAAYRDGSLAWSDLPWVQDIYSSEVGLRQTWCRIELQLTSPSSTAQTLPFLGSAAVYHDYQAP